MKLFYETSKLYNDVTGIRDLINQFIHYVLMANKALEYIDEEKLTNIFLKWKGHVVFVKPSEDVTRVIFEDGVNDESVEVRLKDSFLLFPQTIVSVGIDLIDGKTVTFVLGESFASDELLKKLKMAFKKAEFSGNSTMQITVDDLLELF